MASISSALPARVGIFNQHDSAAATNGLNFMLAEERWRLYFYFIIRHTHRPFFPIKTDCINVDAFTHKQGFFFFLGSFLFVFENTFEKSPEISLSKYDENGEMKIFWEMHKKVFRWYVYSNELMPK